MIHLLIVDDEEFNLRIIEESLEGEGYLLTRAKDGKEAWDILTKKNIEYSAIILDRLMPKLDGIEVLKKIKNDDDLKEIPVILQTALSSTQDILDGLECGAFYYLTKPYSKKVLISIINLAVENHFRYQKAKEELHKTKNLMQFLKEGDFEIRTIDEMLELAPVISNVFPDPNRVLTGVIELITNAIEHGNLGIGYDRKLALQEKGTYNKEVKKRMNDPKYKERKVKIQFKKDPESIQVSITDEGKGFDVKKFQSLDEITNHLFLSSGRGIIIAKTMSFDELNYNEKGNSVIGLVYTAGK